MKKTAVLIQFAENSGVRNTRIFDALYRLLDELKCEDPSMTFKEFDDEHGGPVIYFP